jgi:dolichol-phosphate mannosyltransferase
MISIIVPTYRERQALDALLPRLVAVHRTLPESAEVLIVDDASDDGTAELADEILGRERMGRAIRRTGPRDLCAAIIEGSRQAHGDVLAVMDADLSHPPELLPTLLAAVRAGSDIAVASRYVPGGRVEGWPWRRRLLSRTGVLLARPLTRVSDPTSGYFACRAPLLQSLTPTPGGFKVLLELLAHAPRSVVREVPYVFQDRRAGSSKLSPTVGWRYLLQVGRLYRLRK